MKISKSQVQKKVGEIATIDYVGHTVNGFMCGLIPIKIRTDMLQEDWDKFCDGTLSNSDMIRLKLCGIL